MIPTGLRGHTGTNPRRSFCASASIAARMSGLRKLSNAIPDLIEPEQKLWLLDLQINDRGIRVDAPAAEAILSCVSEHSEALEADFRRMTGLASPRQRDATLGLLKQMGADMWA